MLSSYVVKGKNGYYTELIQKKNSQYRGLDGMIWPLWEEDAQNVKNINFALYTEIKQCITYNQYNVIGTCTELSFLNQYISVCHEINLPIEVLKCVICKEKGIEQKEIDTKKYVFLGYDYVMIGGNYSPLVQEIEHIKKKCDVQLNQYGLIETYSEVLEFVHERKEAKVQNNGIGFEYGEDLIDYYIVALFEYIGNFPITQ